MPRSTNRERTIRSVVRAQAGRGQVGPARIYNHQISVETSPESGPTRDCLPEGVQSVGDSNGRSGRFFQKRNSDGDEVRSQALPLLAATRTTIELIFGAAFKAVRPTSQVII